MNRGLVGTLVSGKLVTHGYLALSLYAGASLVTASFLVLSARLQRTSKVVAKVKLLDSQHKSTGGREDRQPKDESQNHSQINSFWPGDTTSGEKQ